MKRLIAAVALCAAGCTDSGHADLEAFIEETARASARTHGPVAAGTDPSRYGPSREPFVYVAGELRSPFQPPPAPASTADTGQPPIAPDLERTREHLEQFPLAQLRLVGSLFSHRAHAVLVRDPDGMIHPVGVGDYMGENFGHIRAVTEGGVELVEIIRDAGGWTERTRFIPLGGEQGNGE